MHMQAIAIHMRYNNLSLGNCGLSQCLHNSLQNTSWETEGNQRLVCDACYSAQVDWKRCIVEEHSQTIATRGAPSN